MRGAEIERAGRKGPDNPNAYDLYLRALPHAYAYTREGRTQALKLLSQALANDPDYVEAHGLAAWCHIQRIWAEAAQSPADLASAHKHAETVMSLTTADASTLAFAANAYARATQDYQTAIQMIEHAWRAWLLALSGKGWWRLSGSPPANEAMTLQWFKATGLVSLSTYHAALQPAENRRVR